MYVVPPIYALSLSPCHIASSPQGPLDREVYADFGTHTLCILISNQRGLLRQDRGGAVCGVQIKIPLWRLGNSIIFHLLHGHAS